MGTPLLTVDRLRVDYDDVTAVDDVSFTVEAGMVYGLVGPNGAGKSSIIRSVATLVEPSNGSVNVCGVDLMDDPRRAMRHLGFMPDFPPLYEDLTVREFMELFASAYGLSPSSRASRIGELIERVQLTGKLDAPSGSLSRGMRQRLFLAKTLLHDPDVLLLDEPASGLDPLARMELCNILVELGRAGKAVLVSSHILPEMADFCNSVGIMERGRMVVTGRVDEILQKIQPGTRIRVRLLAETPNLLQFLQARPGVRDASVEGARATVQLESPEADVASLLGALISNGFPVVDFHPEQGDLQDIFMRVSTGAIS